MPRKEKWRNLPDRAVCAGQDAAHKGRTAGDFIGLVSLRETRAEDGNILQKLGGLFRTEPIDWLAIDLSDWSGSRAQLYEDIKNAILARRPVQFDYYGKNGQMSRRTVEPVKLVSRNIRVSQGILQGEGGLADI